MTYLYHSMSEVQLTILSCAAYLNRSIQHRKHNYKVHGDVPSESLLLVLGKDKPLI